MIAVWLALKPHIHANSKENSKGFIYIFGHTHIQWNYRSYDGKKLLINPGSCGLPLDCVDAGMPYTILDILNTDNIVVEERRVPFPLEEYISIFRQSEQFSKVNVWSRIILKELKTKKNICFIFCNLRKSMLCK